MVKRSRKIEIRVKKGFKLALKASRYTRWGETLPLEGVRIPVYDAIYFSLIKECYTPCEVILPAGLAVRIIAPATAYSYVFVEWSDGKRERDRVINMVKDIELEARYSPP